MICACLFTTFCTLGVQIEYDVVHLRTSLVQLFILLQLNFEEVVQIIELRRFGGAPNGYPFAALIKTYICNLRILLSYMYMALVGRMLQEHHKHVDSIKVKFS
jgi:hypothetical protein